MNFTDITVKDRVMLFLLDYIKEDLLDASESESDQVLKSLPVEITQEGIAESVGIRWNHSSRALKELTGMGLVEMKKANIAGGRRSRRVYFLTEKGIDATNNVLTQINNSEFEILRKGQLEKMSFAQIHRKYASDLAFFDFLRRFEQIFPKIVQEGSILESIDIRTGIDSVARVHHHRTLPSIDILGRHSEMQLINDVIQNGPNTLVVIGLPGMGKTAIISSMLKKIEDRDTFYYPIHEWDSPRSILTEISKFLEELKKVSTKGLFKRIVNRRGPSFIVN